MIYFVGKSKMSGVLSDAEIEAALATGDVVYHHPSGGTPPRIGNCSIDVTLGRYFFRQNLAPGCAAINPFVVEDVHRMWGTVQQADNGFITLAPHEHILAHTQEFIGGARNVTTMMKARSTMGRSNITVCRDAGWGDIGYINRWTMEITNNNDVDVILPVDAPIAQIVFFHTGITKKSYQGRYQHQTDLSAIIASWAPESMLPKVHTASSTSG